MDVDRFLRRGFEVTLDFSKTTILYPCGLLVLMGWVDEWVKKYRGRVRAAYPETDLVEQMLQHVDVLPKLGLPKRCEVSHNDVVRWHYFSGRNVDPTPIEPFMEELQTLMGEEKQLGLGNCVTEAMVNVRHHAYDSEGGPWWIFATVSAGRLFMAMYDRGASIPGTLLEKPEVLDYLTGRMWAIGRGDGKLIAAACGGRTSTLLDWRGKGLPEMLEFTRTLTNSELGIFSRKGFFRFDGAETVGRLKTPITGTLLIWMLTLPPKGTT
ncbi:MAG: hypothetical protein JSS56_07830 [Proteobacteria bacterium]|nr:hypothetical protein [Pseudomonadota bacterium]